MGLDLKDYQFIGLANTVAMEDFSASFYDDRDNATCLALLRMYRDAGEPTDARRWLHDQLESIFFCFKARPQWIELPMWPFLNGRAMTFIEQLTVEANRFSEAYLAPDTVLYVFGARVPVEGGWEMRYRVVEQHASLAI